MVANPQTLIKRNQKANQNWLDNKSQCFGNKYSKSHEKYAFTKTFNIENKKNIK